MKQRMISLEFSTAYLGTYVLSVAVIAYELDGDLIRASQAALVGTLFKVIWNYYANRLMWRQIRGRARNDVYQPGTSPLSNSSTGEPDGEPLID